MNSPSQSESGFTVLELLVSVVIVGLLAATSVNATKLYKERAYDATQRQFYQTARTSFEGRNEWSGPQSYRYVYQNFNSSSWIKYGVTDKSELTPGLPEVPDHFRVFIREWNCTSSNCTEQYMYVMNCKTGNALIYYNRPTGYEYYTEYYSPTYDAYC